MLEEFRLLDASAYSSVPNGKLHVVSTTSVQRFPVAGVSQNLARVACNWAMDTRNRCCLSQYCWSPDRMSDHALTEEPLHFGEGGRLFGILTLPADLPGNARELPVFVFLSAGLLHRAGPRRLHVHLARELARMASVHCG